MSQETVWKLATGQGRNKDHHDHSVHATTVFKKGPKVYVYRRSLAVTAADRMRLTRIQSDTPEHRVHTASCHPRQTS